jgi:hypothetical protein
MPRKSTRRSGKVEEEEESSVTNPPPPTTTTAAAATTTTRRSGRTVKPNTFKVGGSDSSDKATSTAAPAVPAAAVVKPVFKRKEKNQPPLTDESLAEQQKRRTTAARRRSFSPSTTTTTTKKQLDELDFPDSDHETTDTKKIEVPSAAMNDDDDDDDDAPLDNLKYKKLAILKAKAAAEAAAATTAVKSKSSAAAAAPKATTTKDNVEGSSSTGTVAAVAAVAAPKPRGRRPPKKEFTATVPPPPLAVVVSAPPPPPKARMGRPPKEAAAAAAAAAAVVASTTIAAQTTPLRTAAAATAAAASTTTTTTGKQAKAKKPPTMSSTLAAAASKVVESIAAAVVAAVSNPHSTGTTPLAETASSPVAARAPTKLAQPSSSSLPPPPPPTSSVVARAATLDQRADTKSLAPKPAGAKMASQTVTNAAAAAAQSTGSSNSSSLATSKTSIATKSSLSAAPPKVAVNSSSTEVSATTKAGTTKGTVSPMPAPTKALDTKLAAVIGSAAAVAASKSPTIATSKAATSAKSATPLPGPATVNSPPATTTTTTSGKASQSKTATRTTTAKVTAAAAAAAAIRDASTMTTEKPPPRRRSPWDNTHAAILPPNLSSASSPPEAPPILGWGSGPMQEDSERSTTSAASQIPAEYQNRDDVDSILGLLALSGEQTGFASAPPPPLPLGMALNAIPVTSAHVWTAQPIEVPTAVLPNPPTDQPKASAKAITKPPVPVTVTESGVPSVDKPLPAPKQPAPDKAASAAAVKQVSERKKDADSQSAEPPTEDVSVSESTGKKDSCIPVKEPLPVQEDTSTDKSLAVPEAPALPEPKPEPPKEPKAASPMQVDATEMEPSKSDEMDIESPKQDEAVPETAANESVKADSATPVPASLENQQLVVSEPSERSPMDIETAQEETVEVAETPLDSTTTSTAKKSTSDWKQKTTNSPQKDSMQMETKSGDIETSLIPTKPVGNNDVALPKDPVDFSSAQEETETTDRAETSRDETKLDDKSTAGSVPLPGANKDTAEKAVPALAHSERDSSGILRIVEAEQVHEKESSPVPSLNVDDPTRDALNAQNVPNIAMDTVGEQQDNSSNLETHVAAADETDIPVIGGANSSESTVSGAIAIGEELSPNAQVAPKVLKDGLDTLSGSLAMVAPAKTETLSGEAAQEEEVSNKTVRIEGTSSQIDATGGSLSKKGQCPVVLENMLPSRTTGHPDKAGEPKAKEPDQDDVEVPARAEHREAKKTDQLDDLTESTPRIVKSSTVSEKVENTTTAIQVVHVSGEIDEMAAPASSELTTKFPSSSREVPRAIPVPIETLPLPPAASTKPSAEKTIAVAGRPPYEVVPMIAEQPLNHQSTIASGKNVDLSSRESELGLLPNAGSVSNPDAIKNTFKPALRSDVSLKRSSEHDLDMMERPTKKRLVETWAASYKRHRSSAKTDAQDAPQVDQVTRPNLERIKLMLFSAGSRVHRLLGYERLFAEYWAALSRRLQGNLSAKELRSNQAVLSIFLKTRALRKLHNKMILGMYHD